jgi:hypothetical protein
VSQRARELAERNAKLRLRCAVQRRAVADEVAGIERRLDSVDRAVVMVRGTLFHPAALAAGIGALILIGRRRGAGIVRIVSRGLLLAAASRRLLRLVKRP